MPLLAYTQSGLPLIAPLMTDEVWEHLRAAKLRDAWMSDRGGRAIPKVSPLGTRFFSHPRGATPPGARESATHLFLKAQCLVGAHAAGWEALPEQAGTTPDGQPWRADVLCRRPGQPWSVALEAQIDLQGEPAYRQRQARYAAAQIRALWLVAHEPAALKSYWDQPDRDLPAFRARTWADAQGRPAACVAVDGLSLSVPDFVAGALGGRLHWYEQERHAVVILLLYEGQCWHRTCRSAVFLTGGARTRAGRAVEIAAVAELEGFSGAYARAQAAVPDLADSPQPYRRGFVTRCPHCGREIRYPKGKWMSGAGVQMRVPIGLVVPDRAARERPCLRPHADWHWGEPARWAAWAPVGDIGPITRGNTPNRGYGPRRGHGDLFDQTARVGLLGRS
jgi:hypothetical protein